MIKFNKILPRNKKVYQVLIISIITLSFSACNNDETNAAFSNTQNITSCNSTVNNTDGYTALSSGDTIIRNSDTTQVSIFHDSDGNKNTCVSSGSAYIIKA